jgi:hypothetical protein
MTEDAELDIGKQSTITCSALISDWSSSSTLLINRDSSVSSPSQLRSHLSRPTSPSPFYRFNSASGTCRLAPQDLLQLSRKLPATEPIPLSPSNLLPHLFTDLPQTHPRTMAIYPKLNPAPQSHLSPTDAANIETWTEQATVALSAISLSPAQATRGTRVSLAIPLDGTAPAQASRAADTNTQANSATATPPHPSSGYQRREPIRRDSLKRRESLLKGKEGSRRRQRWENGMCAVKGVRVIMVDVVLGRPTS